MIKDKRIISIFARTVVGFWITLLVFNVVATPFLVRANQSTSSIDASLNNGILYLESVQNTSIAHKGEFATYCWLLPDQSDKEYNYSVFTTPFILHTLNLLSLMFPHLTQVRTMAYENMRSMAAGFLMNNIETLDGHTGVWRFYPGNPLPPDFCDTCCNLESVLSFNASLWEHPISNDLTDYFLTYRRPSGAFCTWFLPMNTDVCASTNANTLFFYASRNEEQKVQTTMDWLNERIRLMLLGLPYDASYYRSPYAFMYLATRAYADGGASTFLNASQREKMRHYILSNQQTDGSWPFYPGYVGTEDELETSLAIVSLVNLGFGELNASERAKVKNGIDYLLTEQNSDGSWPCASFYEGPRPKIYYGSNELTTSIAMEALAKYSAVSVGGVFFAVDKPETSIPNTTFVLTVVATLATLWTAVHVRHTGKKALAHAQRQNSILCFSFHKSAIF